jgi:serine phosphatase RsbU (regulator of sigma subunit)
MTPQSSDALLRLALTHERDLYVAGELARQLGRLLGLSVDDRLRLTTAISEIARELLEARVTAEITFTLTEQPSPTLLVSAEWVGELGGANPAGVDLRLPGLLAATRLVDSLRLEVDQRRGQVRMATKLSRDPAVGATADQLRHLGEQARWLDSTQALRRHNEEVAALLDTLQARHLDMDRATRELEETNRGVVALYSELEETSARLRDTANILQRALLTAPPDVDGIQLCVRYRPAAAHNEAGGDWYDVFHLRDGDLAVAVGDVAGHDIAAAATMGQLRSIMRGLAYEGNDRPHGALEALDRVVRGMRLTPLTSAIYSRLHLSARGARSEGDVGVEMSWANAGLPGIIVLRPQLPATLLDTPRDPPLGVDDDIRRHSGKVWLPGGATLLWFSDGLIERRGEPFDKSISELVRRAERTREAPLHQLCDELVNHAPDRDDLVLVALRLDKDAWPMPRPKT